MLSTTMQKVRNTIKIIHVQVNNKPFFLYLQIIFVLTHDFVNSEWCNYELCFAQQKAVGKTFSDIILVVKEPIDAHSLPNKYCKLKKMLNNKTYLEWPQQKKQQAFFWAQLKSVLGKPTLAIERMHSVRSNVSSVSAMSVKEHPLEDRIEIATASRAVEIEMHKEVVHNIAELHNQNANPVT